MLTLLVVLCVAAVLFVAAAWAVSDRELLVDVVPDGSGTALPAGRVAAEDVDAVRFGLALRGYRMDEVDRVLARLAQELAERDARIVELETAIADAVGPAVEGVESSLAREREQEVAAELEAAREEAPVAPAERLGAAGRPPAAAAGPTGLTGLPAVAAWSALAAGARDSAGPPTAPSEPATAEPATSEPATPEPAVPEPAVPAPEPVVPAPVVAGAEPASTRHAPPWPAAEPVHPEPVVPDAVLVEPVHPEPVVPDAVLVEPVLVDAGFAFPEVAPPDQADPSLPESTDPGRAAEVAEDAVDTGEERGLT